MTTATTMTLRQVSADLRTTLRKAASRGGVRFPAKGIEIELPAGLGFTARATRTGVNITITDAGWVDAFTSGDREQIVVRQAEFQQEQDAITAEVDKIRGAYEPRLPGRTTWAPIPIRGRVTSVSRLSYDDADAEAEPPF